MSKNWTITISKVNFYKQARVKSQSVSEYGPYSHLQQGVVTDDITVTVKIIQSCTGNAQKLSYHKALQSFVVLFGKIKWVLVQQCWVISCETN